MKLGDYLAIVGVMSALMLLAFTAMAHAAPCKNLCYGAPKVVGDQTGGAVLVKVRSKSQRPVRARFMQQWRVRKGARVKVIARSSWRAQNVRGARGQVRRTAKVAWHGRRRSRGQTRFCWTWLASVPRAKGRTKCTGWRSARLR